MMRRLGMVLALGLALLAGCSSVPPGYEKVNAIVRPEGRPTAFLPFVPQYRGATLVDGIKLSELASLELRQAMPDLKIYGPSAMQKALSAGMNESRWVEIGREAGAELLVVGNITYLETYHDKLVQSREGVIGIRFRVLDVSKAEALRIANVNWQFGFPEEPGDKFDPAYLSMDPLAFRNELLKLGARRIAELFYDHVRKQRAESRLEVRSYQD
jgi:hypothetical protein